MSSCSGAANSTSRISPELARTKPLPSSGRDCKKTQVPTGRCPRPNLALASMSWALGGFAETMAGDMAKELSEWKIAEVDQGREPPGTRPFARYVAADGHPFIDTDGSLLNLAKAQSTITWWFFALPLMAAVLGWLSWSPLVSDQVGALLLILVPVLWVLSTSRLQAGLTMGC